MSTALAPDPAAAAIVDPPAPVAPPAGDPVAPTPDPVAPTDPASAPTDPAAAVETTEEKEARERDEAGRFKAKEIDYSTVILPKDAAIDPAVLERTVAIARERGLSTEQAQATVDLINSEVAQSKAALLAAHQPGGAEWTKQLDAWKAETLADPTLGKTPEERTAAVQRGAAVLKKYATENPTDAQGMTDFLDKSGLGEHPMAVRFFNWLGKAAGERSLTLPTTSGVARSPVDIFYPKGPNRSAQDVAADP